MLPRSLTHSIHTDCVHLGEELRTEQCKSCAGMVKVKVLACSEFGECSILKKLPGVACCNAGCAKYQQGVSK